MIRNGVAVYVHYSAWDVDANAPKTGDVANHTLKIVNDGVVSAPSNSPAEIAAGEYRLELTAAESLGAKFIAVGGVSSTPDVYIIPAMIVTDLLIPSGVVFVACYTAWDMDANAPKTGDVANHTLTIAQDGTSAVADNSPAEIDATNLPGLYKIIVTASEGTGTAVSIVGVSSTGDVVIMSTELGPYTVIFAPPSNDPLRQRIMDAVKTRLESILVAGGYKTNAGQNVFAWRKFGIPDSELPALVYQDSDHSQDQGAIDLVDNFLEVTVEAIAVKGATSEDQIREMLADVIAAIGVDETWGALAFDTSQPSTPMEAEQLEQKLFGASITFIIEYNTGRFDAYG